MNLMSKQPRQEQEDELRESKVNKLMNLESKVNKLMNLESKRKKKIWIRGWQRRVKPKA